MDADGSHLVPCMMAGSSIFASLYFKIADQFPSAVTWYKPGGQTVPRVATDLIHEQVRAAAEGMHRNVGRATVWVNVAALAGPL